MDPLSELCLQCHWVRFQHFLVMHVRVCVECMYVLFPLISKPMSKCYIFLETLT